MTVCMKIFRPRSSSPAAGSLPQGVPALLGCTAGAVRSGLLVALLLARLHAAEETEFSWPLGPVGGKMRLWTSENFVRVSELTPGAPGAVAGLQVNDFILGAFGREFDVLGSDFEGVVRQLGNAIEHAESNDGVLPLQVLRSGTGLVTVTVNLPALGAMDPAFPLTSTKYAATYEYACAQLHARVMADSDGDLGYPTGFTGLALLGHPHWNDSAGPTPYRLSINKLRDWAIGMINNGQLTPVEDKYYDGSANPNYASTGLENWSLGQAVMFLAEYVTKTGEQASYQAVLQRGAVMMANRIQNWAQPANGGTADLTYEETRGATSHGGVTGDYTHQWYVGINMAGVHLFDGLALAKRAGADMTERPKDGHYFGHNLNPGDTVPANIAPALPASIVLPRGAQDTASGYAGLDNVTHAPLTTVNDPFFYDCSLDQKFWLKWDFLTRSTSAEGWVAYATVTGAAYDAGGRTPASLFGLKAYHGNTPLSALDQEVASRQMSYIIAAHNRHLNAHAYNMGGGLFTALVMPWFSDRDQRYFWDNWKFYANLMRQPDGSLQYFRGRPWGDAYQDETLVVLVNNALPRSVALGGLPHVPGYDTNRVFVRFKQPLLEWPAPEARRRRVTGGTESFTADVIDASGAVIPPAQVTAAWSVLSGPVTSGLLANASALNTTASFPQAGTYRLQLDVNANSLSTSEQIDIEVMPSVPPGYAAGEADYQVYTGISGSSVSSLTSAAAYPDSPAETSVLSSLEGTYSGSNYGSVITTTIVAPETGTYRFYIASDDESSLRLNASGPSPGGAVQIASVPGWTNPYQWDKYSAQQSAAIALTAGQQCSLQALHKEGGGGDHLAVAWTTPSGASITVIGAPYIARELPAAASPAILSQPQPVTANLGDNVSLTFTATGGDPALYQWRLNGVNFGSPQTGPTLQLSNIGARLAGSWDCVFTSGNTVLTTNPATVTINGLGIVTPGGLWQELFTGVSGGTVDALLASPSYPLLSSSSSVLTGPHTGTLGDDYGQRWTGWLIPGTSGRYRFYAAADDQTRLYLSPDEYECHKQLIHSITSYTGEMSWSSRSPSAWIALEAGKRYYVEFLHAEGGGGDHAAFTWQKEGDPVPANGAGLIPSAHLEYITGGNVPDAAVAPPFAQADALNAETGAPATLDVLANDLDASNATLLVTAVTQPAHGSVTFSGRNVTYTSEPGFGGSDSFTYTVRNGLHLNAVATVNVTVSSPWNGLLAWWRFNENTGTAAADSTGNGHTATLTSGTAWTTGRSGSGIWIASSTQMAATAPGKPIPDSFTIAAWMNPVNSSGIDTIFSFGSTAAFRTNGSRLRFTTFGIADHDTNTGMFSGGAWTHVALTFTPGTSDGAKFYVNGVLRQALASSAIGSSPGVWRIGAAHVSSEWFGGGLDDVRLFGRVLTDAEISLIAAAPTPWQDWRADHFTPPNLANLNLSGPSPDADHDGLPNLMEYALDLSPNQATPLNQRIVSELDGEQYLRLSITRNPNATDVLYTVEVSSDLSTWTTAGVITLQSTPSLLQVRDSQPASTANRRFMRLSVTQP